MVTAVWIGIAALLVLWSDVNAVRVLYPSYPKPGKPIPIPPKYPVNPPKEETVCVCNCKFDGCDTCPDPPDDAEVCEWQLVFKERAGQGQNVFDDWTSADPINEGDPLAMDLTNALPFKSPFLSEWNLNTKVKEVKVVLIDIVGGTPTPVVWFLFDGVASTKNDWFSQARIISTDRYPDIKEEMLNGFDSISGQTMSALNRRFHLQTPGNGCPGSCGFMTVFDMGSVNDCRDMVPKPYFAYSILPGCGIWENPAQTSLADVLAVYVKTCPIIWPELA